VTITLPPRARRLKFVVVGSFGVSVPSSSEQAVMPVASATTVSIAKSFLIVLQY